MIVLNPEIHLNINSNLELDLSRLLRQKEASELCKKLGEAEFIKQVNSTGIVHIANNKVTFILDDNIKQAYSLIVNSKDAKVPIKEVIGDIPCLKYTEMGMGKIILLLIQNEKDANELKAKLTEQNFTVKSDLETKKDAYLRMALKQGVTNEDIEKARQEYQKSLNKIAFVANPKIQGYQKTTEEFKRESGYDMFRPIICQLD